MVGLAVETTNPAREATLGMLKVGDPVTASIGPLIVTPCRQMRRIWQRTVRLLATVSVESAPSAAPHANSVDVRGIRLGSSRNAPLRH